MPLTLIGINQKGGALYEKNHVRLSLLFALTFALYPVSAQSQPDRGGSGYGMGPGMMGSGYGSTQHPSGGKAIEQKEARAMVSDYLKNSRNPNLKLGKIKDVGRAFEAQILTTKNDLVDKILIDKSTGYMRSAY